MHDAAGLLTEPRAASPGCSARYLALVELLLLARLPVFDAARARPRRRLAPAQRHRRARAASSPTPCSSPPATRWPTTCRSPPRPSDLLTGYPGVMPATIALGLLVAVGADLGRGRCAGGSATGRGTPSTSTPTSPSRWPSATSSRPATSSCGQPLARAYWWALYVGDAGGARRLPDRRCRSSRSLRHRLRVERVVPEAPGVVSLEIGGVGLERLRRARGPVASLALPRARPLVGGASVLALGGARRPAAAHHGQGARRLHPRAWRSLPPGTRVIVEGPFGGLTSAARRRPRVALIAGGVGITPIRALLEDMPGEPGTIAVIYRARERGRRPLPRRARRAGAPARGRAALRARRHRGDEMLSAEHLQALVPDIAGRDVYVCGPPA